MIIRYATALIISILFLVPFPLIETQATTMPKPPEQSREELYHDMFLTLLSKDINKAVADYYSDYLTISPMVHGYMVDVISAEREGGYRSFGFTVTLEVTPVVGPHLSVGKERIVYDIGPGGGKLLEYKHLETHELPNNWKHILKNISP
ncbi:DUF3888 domain-containing protein [Bacillus tianshenii]|uniref:DUF3888 domain-containing protein n=1 Tax=Sutcliffiella tianshenii TaxID=1463404 RepID=UPI001CD28F1E|nr:DUF3888 domain-containing protein [Bacillus tianshenii]MCA1322211.1 DUF3888 domain-containing protein [Bacillus tianshenii]